MKKLTQFFVRIWRRYQRNRVYNRAKKPLQREFDRQLKGRRQLRKDIDVFLRKFFNIEGKSKFIPPSYKNTEEVRLALQHHFGDRLTDLNLSIEDFLK